MTVNYFSLLARNLQLTLVAAEPFSDEFKKHTSAIASGPCSYGLIPKEHWPPGNEMPEGVNTTEAWAVRPFFRLGLTRLLHCC